MLFIYNLNLFLSKVKIENINRLFNKHNHNLLPNISKIN